MDTSRRMLVVFYSRSETTAAVERRLADRERHMSA